jgi:hypothetical protein
MPGPFQLRLSKRSSIVCNCLKLGQAPPRPFSSTPACETVSLPESLIPLGTRVRSEAPVGYKASWMEGSRFGTLRGPSSRLESAEPIASAGHLQIPLPAASRKAAEVPSATLHLPRKPRSSSLRTGLNVRFERLG